MEKETIYLVREADGINVAYNDSIFKKRKDAETYYSTISKLKGYTTMLIKVYGVDYNKVVNNGLDTALGVYALVEVIKQK